MIVLSSSDRTWSGWLAVQSMLTGTLSPHVAQSCQG